MPNTRQVRTLKSQSLSRFPGKILIHNPHENSLAGLIALKRLLFKQNFTVYYHRSCRNHKRDFLIEQFNRGPVTCFKCKKLLKKGTLETHGDSDVATVDHIIPISKRPDLAKTKSNFRIACGSCNRNRKS